MKPFEQQLKEAGPYVWSIANKLSRSKEDAEDSMQEATILALQAWARYKDHNFKKWFAIILANYCFNKLKKDARHKTIRLSPDFDVADTPQFTPDDDPDTWLEDAIESLPEQFRIAIKRSMEPGMAYPDIAEIEGIPINTVRSRVSRAKEKIRKYAEKRPPKGPGEL